MWQPPGGVYAHPGPLAVGRRMPSLHTRGSEIFFQTAPSIRVRPFARSPLTRTWKKSVWMRHRAGDPVRMTLDPLPSAARYPCSANESEMRSRGKTTLGQTTGCVVIQVGEINSIDAAVCLTIHEPGGLSVTMLWCLRRCKSMPSCYTVYQLTLAQFERQIGSQGLGSLERNDSCGLCHGPRNHQHTSLIRHGLIKQPDSSVS